MKPHRFTCFRSYGAALASACGWALLAGCSAAPLRYDPVYFPPPPAQPHAVHLKSFNSLAELVPVKVSWTEIIRGSALSPHVATPGGLAFAGDSLFICDPGSGVVHRWNLATGQATRLGVGDDQPLATPVDVAVDSAGTVYVADTGRGEVVAFDADGAVIRQIKPAQRDGYRPVAVAVAASRLYVADIAAHQVDMFSTADGQLLGAIGAAGGDSPSLYFPVGLATDSGGNLLVCEMLSARVQVFNSQHNHKLTIGQPGDRYGDLGKPKRVAVGPDTTIFISDAEFARVHLFNDQGQLLMLLGGTPMPVGLAIARALPSRLASAVPDGFEAQYYLFVSNTVGPKRISLYAIGLGR